MTVTVKLQIFGVNVGLRQDKARSKRTRIIEVSLRLFAERGFEQTPMETIAQAAGISPSTLYRCFPSKDLIVLEGFTSEAERFADAFAATDPSTPVDEALATAMLAVMRSGDRHPERTELLRSILDQTPSARARLWDLLATERERIGRTLARRLNLQQSDPRVILSARLALLVLETAADLCRKPGNRRSSHALVINLIRFLNKGEITLPKIAR
jgi:AcrR family transcriptional regulator